jgi:SAM-dependent methyltransferase
VTEADALNELASAYEGLEWPGSFESGASLVNYRNALRERTRRQTAFITRRLRTPGRVLEVGCGNGRLLIDLAQKDAINGALGIDLAESRVAFAARWAADEHCPGLEFTVGDVLDHPLPAGGFVAAFCITGAFGYFEPISEGAARRLARKLQRALSKDGLLCLEIYPHHDHRRLLAAAGGRARIWSELPQEDPWRFYLSDLQLDDSATILTHDKTFIHRNSGRIDSGRRERLRLYDEQSLSDLLLDAGFHDIENLEGWGDEPYRGGEIMVVTARA